MNKHSKIALETLQKSVDEQSLVEVRLRSADPNRTLDAFLDDINSYKAFLKEKTALMQELMEHCEALTWAEIDKDKDEELMPLNRLIGALERLYSILDQRKISVQEIHSRLKIAEEETKAYSQAVDDLREMINDLDLVFFGIPNDSEMQELASKVDRL